MKIITKAHHKEQIEVKLHELFAVEIEGSQAQGQFSTNFKNFTVVKEYKYSEPAFTNVQKIGKKLYLMMATHVGETTITCSNSLSNDAVFEFSLNVVVKHAVSAGSVSDDEPMPGSTAQLYH